MNYSDAYLYEHQARTRKLVFCDLERHFASIESRHAEEAMAALAHIPFDKSLAFDCALGEIGQFDLSVGMAEDEMELTPFFTVSTGISASITIYAPTSISTKTQFYKELMEQMFHMPATEDLVRWWSESANLPSRITINFTEDDATFCDVVIDLCSAASQATADPWSSY